MGEFVSLLAAFSYALSNVLVKKGTTPTSKNNGAFLSLVLTVIISGILWIVIISINGFPSLSGAGIIWFIIGGVLSAFFGRNFQYSSVQHLGAIRASALKNLNPLFTVILGIIFLNEKLNLFFFIGMFLIFLGLYFMVRQSVQSSRQTSEPAVSIERRSGSLKDFIVHVIPLVNIGYFFGTLSALSYALGFVVRKKGLESIPDPLFGILLGGFIGTVVFLIMALFKERYVFIIKSTFTTFNPWLFFGGVAMTVGQVFNFFAIFYLDVSRAALLITTQTIFSILLSLLIFKTKENVNKLTIINTFIILIGVVFIIYE